MSKIGCGYYIQPMIVFLRYVTERNMLRTFKNTVPNNQVIQFIITYARMEELFLEMQKRLTISYKLLLFLCNSSDSNKQSTVNQLFSDPSKEGTKGNGSSHMKLCSFQTLSTANF